MNRFYKNKIRFIKSPPALSKSRQDIFFLQKQTYKLFSNILNSNLLLKGILYQLRHTCGKSNCKCAKSSYRHVNWYLSRSEQGKTKVYYIKQVDLLLFKRLTEEYKRFRESRHKIVKIYREIINLINQIEKIKTRPFWEGQRYGKKTKRKLHLKK